MLTRPGAGTANRLVHLIIANGACGTRDLCRRVKTPGNRGFERRGRQSPSPRPCPIGPRCGFEPQVHLTKRLPAPA